MAIKVLEKCCCFDLKTAVLIIGIFSIVVSVGGLIEAPVSYSQACSGGATPQNDANCAAASSKLGGSISSEVIGIILMGLMIYGSQKESYGLMLPIIILQAIGIIIIFLFVWYLTIVFFTVSVGTGFLFMILGNAIVGITVYFWLVIYSRCQEIKNMTYTSANTA
ncbi:uncharacterized protein LOC123270334 isoform X1 [Cotesia glomerata]|uniref:Uncharacterized protein n=1 Tax=Cotesia glomerata TaxID=32391 RepID=A0AAV7IL25_COTGL|nr:uncharacterized protein LOC123270334 isoform X1 [Cotesia glomerata]KAH0551937.1 hypothetical protein KQX54_003275 [Cotesia glomerata]